MSDSSIEALQRELEAHYADRMRRWHCADVVDFDDQGCHATFALDFGRRHYYFSVISISNTYPPGWYSVCVELGYFNPEATVAYGEYSLDELLEIISDLERGLWPDEKFLVLDILDTYPQQYPELEAVLRDQISHVSAREWKADGTGVECRLAVSPEAMALPVPWRDRSLGSPCRIRVCREIESEWRDSDLEFALRSDESGYLDLLEIRPTDDVAWDGIWTGDYAFVLTDPSGQQTRTLQPAEIRFWRVSRRFGFLSNSAPYPIRLDGEGWWTSEHYFQAQKFEDPAHRERIRVTESPIRAVVLGRDRTQSPRRDWESVKVDVMRKAVRAKFRQHRTLRDGLLSTGRARIVAHTPSDAFWGDGGDGSGRNVLGKILMEVREELEAHPVVSRPQQEIPRAVEESFVSGQRTDRVPFACGDEVRILSGPHKGSSGNVLLIEQLDPELVLCVILGTTGEDVGIPGSHLRLVPATD